MVESFSRNRSLEIAKEAIRHIVRLEQSGAPPSYEVWYHYAAGDIPQLNETIDGIVDKSGRVTEFEIDEIRRRYLRPSNMPERLKAIGQTFNDEVEQVLGMVEEAIVANDALGTNLAAAQHRVIPSIDRQSLRLVIESIILATKEAQIENGKLGARLIETRQNVAELQEHLDLVRLESLTDPLTGVANRRYFDQFLSRALSEAERAQTPISLLLADIDHFKRFNDEHGHQIGDQVLRLIAAALKQTVKGQDFVARYGGEEFAVVLPNSSEHQARAVAENIRRAVAAHEIIKRPDGANLGRVTVSIGVAKLSAGMNIQSLVEAADACLYAAKRNGRDCVVVESDMAEGTTKEF